MLKLEEYSRLTLSVSLLFILKPVLVSCKPVDLDPLQSVSPSPTTVLVEVTQSVTSADGMIYQQDEEGNLNDLSNVHCMNNKENVQHQYTYYCKADDKCVSNTSRCNNFKDCSDWQDEKDCECKGEEIKCNRRTGDDLVETCLAPDFICDGERDCDDGSDEDCENRDKCPLETTQFCYIQNRRVCVFSDWWCDGEADCDYGEDESPEVCNGTMSSSFPIPSPTPLLSLL